MTTLFNSLIDLEGLKGSSTANMFFQQFVRFIIFIATISVVRGQLVDGINEDVDVNEKNVPFRVIWSIPDSKCGGVYDDVLRDSGIEFNSNRGFIGDKIATLYSPGKFPYFSKPDGTGPINGGIPQKANFTEHLEAIENYIVNTFPEGATGYGIIDFETWRPFYDLNYGGFRVYRYASETYAKRKSKIYNEIIAIAKDEFDTYARELWTATLEKAHELRPNMHWGFYYYPHYWTSEETTKYYDDRMAETYKASTGFFPSIYIKNVLTQDVAGTNSYIIATLKESLRSRAVHVKKNIPIAPYSLISNGNYFFVEEHLDQAIGLPAEMGIDAVVIWGSSNMLRPSHIKACEALNNYARNTLGPYVKHLMTKLNDCSERKCSGLGRCVHKRFAETVPFSLGLNYYEVEKRNDTYTGIYDDYECQCYAVSRDRFCKEI